MNATHTSAGGRLALIVGHCAGMMDMVALPIWVGMVLIGRLGLDPQRAGGLATLFLGAVVASSLYFAPRLNRLPRRRLVPLAYALAGVAFAAMNGVADYGVLAALHASAGLAIGCGLSLVHGTMGESAQPQRLASWAFTSLCIVGLPFVGTLPGMIERLGPVVFFYTMAAVMFVGAAVTWGAFPTITTSEALAREDRQPLPRQVWFGMAGVSMLTLNHAMMFGFIERIGVSNGFTSSQVAGTLISTGLVNLCSAVLAGLFDRRWPAALVMCIGPLLQGAFCFGIAQAPAFWLYAAAAALGTSALTVTHLFAFGFLARQDPTGRAVAATPVMVMAGSATGPLLGGVLAQHAGYGSLGIAAALIGIVSATSFRLASRGQQAAWMLAATPLASAAKDRA